MSNMKHEKPDCSRDFYTAKKIVQETPEIREDRVAAAKLALQNNALMLEGEALAEKLLEDPLHLTEGGE